MVRRGHRLRSLLLPVFVVSIGAVACNEMLGIEEARIDPRFDHQGEGGDGASVASGGSAGTAGSASTPGAGGSGGAPLAGEGGALPSESAGEGGTGAPAPDAGGGGVGALAEAGGGGTLATGGSGALAGSGAVAGSIAEAGAAGAPPEVSFCDSYCADITQFCTGNLQQYRDLDQCLHVCELLPQGTLGETSGNSVACRMRNASDARYAAAGEELAEYCRRAGPGGDSGCGSNCEGFCTLMQSVCTPETSPLYRYASSSACLTECESLPDGVIAYSTSDPLVSDGNTVQCRLFHVNSAAMLDPEEHCEHAMGFTLCEEVETEESHAGH